jgi:hypothetical protein
MAVLDVVEPLHWPGCRRTRSPEYESDAPNRAMGEEMKGLLVITTVFLTAMTVLAYSRTNAAAAMAERSWPREPTMLLLSGGTLLGIGGALRRFTF